MAKITPAIRLELQRTIGRLNTKQIVDLFFKTTNKQAKDMITDFKKGFSIEALEQKWIIDSE